MLLVYYFFVLLSFFPGVKVFSLRFLFTFLNVNVPELTSLVARA